MSNTTQTKQETGSNTTQSSAPRLFSALCSLMKIRDHQYLVLLGIDAQLKSILSSADIEE